jgi:hypothetical protein
VIEKLEDAARLPAEDAIRVWSGLEEESEMQRQDLEQAGAQRKAQRLLRALEGR